MKFMIRLVVRVAPRVLWHLRIAKCKIEWEQAIRFWFPRFGTLKDIHRIGAADVALPCPPPAALVYGDHL